MIKKIQQKLKINLLNNREFIKQSGFSYLIIFINIALSLYAIKNNISFFGKEVYGIWIVCFGLFNLIQVFGLGYLNVNTLNFKYDNEKEIEESINDCFSPILIQTVIFVSTIVTLIIYPNIFTDNPDNYNKIRFLLCTMLPGGIAIILSSHYESILFFIFKKIYYKNTLELIRLGIMYLLFVICILFFDDILVFGIVYSMLNVVLFIGTIFLFKTKVRIDYRKIKFDFQSFKNHFSLANSYWLSNVCLILISQADSFYISLFIKDLSLVTMYSQAYRLNDTSLKFLKKITETKTPKIFKLLKEREFAIVSNIYNKLLLSNLLISILVAAIIVLFGKLFLEWWLDKLIIFDSQLIFILSCLCISGSIHFVFLNLLNISKVKHLIKLVSIIEIISNLILSYFFIKNYGVIGLPIATIISQVISISIIAYNKKSLIHNFK